MVREYTFWPSPNYDCIQWTPGSTLGGEKPHSTVWKDKQIHGARRNWFTVFLFANNQRICPKPLEILF